ncbi:MAG: hypothetical protein U1D55_18070 [Phycisphaerae bacterium]
MAKKKKKKPPRYVNQFAKFIVDKATGNLPPEPEDARNPVAAALRKLNDRAQVRAASERDARERGWESRWRRAF